MPTSSLTAFLRSNGRDTRAADEMLAEQAERRVRARTYEPVPIGTRQHMTTRDRQRAAEFAHQPSSLDVWRAMQGKAGPDGMTPEVRDFELGPVEDDRKRDAKDHENAMRDLLRGKTKPGARAARSGRGTYRG